MNNEVRYRKIHSSLLTDWRYSKEPYHVVLYLHCIMNAFHKDTFDMEKGSFKTSIAKLAKASGISESKVKLVLKDLSSGDNPEIIKSTNNNNEYGYTKITVVNFDEYQNLVTTKPGGGHDMTRGWSPQNQGVVTTNLGGGHDVTTKGGHQVTTKDNVITLSDKKDNIDNSKKSVDDVLSTDVVSAAAGFSFEELISVYPKVDSHKVETKALFNELSSTDKEKCITFAKHLQQIWKQHGDREKYQYMKSCHKFIEDKMFNGKPEDILPAGTKTEIVELKEVTKDPNWKKQYEEYLEKNKHKYLN